MIEQDQQQQLNEKIKQKNIIREIFNLNYNKNKKNKLIQQYKNTVIPVSRQSPAQSTLQAEQEFDNLPSTILTNSVYNANYHNNENIQNESQNSFSQIIMDNSIAQNRYQSISIDNIQIDKMPLEKFIEEGDSIDVGLQDIFLNKSIEYEFKKQEGSIKQNLDKSNIEKSFNRLNQDQQQKKGKKIILVDKFSSLQNKKTIFIENMKDVKLQVVLESALKSKKKERSISNIMAITSNSKQNKNYNLKDTSSPQIIDDKSNVDLENIPSSRWNNNQNNYEQMLSTKETIAKETITKSNKDVNITNISTNAIKDKNTKCRPHPLIAKVRSNISIKHQNQKYINQNSDLNNQPIQQNPLQDQHDIQQNDNSNLSKSVSSTNRRSSSMPRLIKINKSQRKGSQEEFFEIFSPNNIHKKSIHQKNLEKDIVQQQQIQHRQAINQDNQDEKQKKQYVLPISAYLIQQQNKKQEQQYQKIVEVNDKEQQSEMQVQEYHLQRENSINQRDQNKTLSGICNSSNQKSILYGIRQMEASQFSVQNQINDQYNKFKKQSFLNTKATEISNISSLTLKQQGNINSQQTMNQIIIFPKNKNMDLQLQIDQMARSSRHISNHQFNNVNMQSPLQKVLLSVPFQQDESNNVYNNYYSNFSQRLNEILQSDASQCPSFFQQNKPPVPQSQAPQQEKENLISLQNQSNQNLNQTSNLKSNKVIQPQNSLEPKSPITSSSNKNAKINQQISSNSKLPYVGKVEGSISQHNLYSEETSKLYINNCKRGQSSAHVFEDQDKSPITSMSNLQTNQQNYSNNRININKTKSIYENNNNNDRSSIKNETNNYFKKLLKIKNSANAQDISDLSSDHRKNRINKDNRTSSVLQLEEQPTLNLDSKSISKPSIPTPGMRQSKRYFSVIIQQSDKEEKQKILQYANKIQEVISKQKKNYQLSIKKMFA